jgi:hypothetical protein
MHPKNGVVDVMSEPQSKEAVSARIAEIRDGLKLLADYL